MEKQRMGAGGREVRLGQGRGQCRDVIVGPSCRVFSPQQQEVFIVKVCLPPLHPHGLCAQKERRLEGKEGCRRGGLLSLWSFFTGGSINEVTISSILLVETVHF